MSKFVGIFPTLSTGLRDRKNTKSLEEFIKAQNFENTMDSSSNLAQDFFSIIQFNIIEKLGRQKTLFFNEIWRPLHENLERKRN